MPRSNTLKQTALIAALATIYPLQAWAAAGVTQFTTGDVSYQRATASAVPLSRGNNVESGDLITTGNSGRTQLRFTDGGMVSLQPNSQFKITRYSDAGNAQQDSFLVDLARGGMRALTGLIGKRNRENYKVTTTTATIGIRGSGFSMAYNPDGTLAVTTELDAIEVCTQAGCIGLNMGESALVTSATARPTRTRERAHWNPPTPRRLVTARNDDAASDGAAANVPRQVIAGLAFAGAGFSDSPAGDARYYLNGAVLREGDEFRGFLGANNDRGTGGATSSEQDFGNIENGDFIVAGLWDNVTWTGSAPGTLSKSAFVLGQPTPANAMASITNALANTDSLRAEYSLAYGTPVLSSAGPNGTLESTSKVFVDFRRAYNQLDVALDVRMPGTRNTNIENTANQIPTVEQGYLYNLRGTANAEGAGFKGNLSISGEQLTVYAGCGIDTSNACDPCGIGTVAGFFSGKEANRLGLSFTGKTSMHGTLAGAGVFNRGSLGSSPETEVSNTLSPYMSPAYYHGPSNSPYYTLHTHSNDDVYQASYASIEAGEGTTFHFQGSKLTRISRNSIYSSNPEYSMSPGASFHHGAIGAPNEGSRSGNIDEFNTFLGWGYWSSGTKSYYYNGGTVSSSINHFHYVTGQPTASMPYMGEGSYSLLGGTIPTATNGATTITGQLLSTSNLQVNFGTGDLIATINTRFGSTAVDIRSEINIQVCGGSCSGNNNTFRSCDPGTNTFINGMFTGNNAQRAGLTYGKFDPSVGNVRGAAAFQRTGGSGIVSGGGYPY